RLALETGTVLRPTFGVSFTHTRNDLVQEPGKAAVSLTAVSVTACPWRLPLGQIAGVSACAVGDGGWLSATGQEVEAPKTVGRSWWALGGLVRGDLELSREIAVELELGLLAPLVERHFVTTPTLESAGTTPAATPLGTLGIIYIF